MVVSTNISTIEQAVWDKLQEVKDPEIPVISVVDLGIITNVKVTETKAHITMTPTFVGCPAIDYMKVQLKKAVEELNFDEVEVTVDYETAWSSNLITDAGREQLVAFGLSAPPKHDGEVKMEDLEHAKCPNCTSTNTSLNTPFGPTLCRAIHICYDCKETFEQFKPV